VTAAVASAWPGPVGGRLLCSHPVDPAEPRCPAFALAGITAHACCCGGCVTSPARPEPADRSEAAA
jgi:hypothetical protein